MDKNSRNQQGWLKRIWHNYVVRNIILAVSLVIIVVFLTSLLLNLFTRHNKYTEVPDFSGITIAEAKRLASHDDLRIEINDSLFVAILAPGVILEQRPTAGTKVKPGRRIYVTVNSSEEKTAQVPYVAGYSLRQAKNILETAGFGIEKLVYVNDIATNNVLDERVGAQTVTATSTVEARIGSGVTLTVGRAPDAEPVTVPRIVGLPLREARSRIWEAGLNIKGVEQDADIDQMNIRQARVYMQVPEQGQRKELGSGVMLYLSLDSTRIATGTARSDKASTATALRERAILDSLSKAGFRGDELQEEFEWTLKVDNGEAKPEDRPRLTEQAILESLENYGESIDEGTDERFTPDEFFPE